MIVLTGGTGFLGRELLGRLLLTRPKETIGLLVRPTAQESADARVRALLADVFTSNDIDAYAERIQVIEGDLALKHFGLGQSEFDSLSNTATEIFHSAATTNLDVALEEARRINVAGTSNVAELASSAQARHGNCKLHHVSTAYVAGATEGVVQASSLSLDGPFKNYYEQSKAEAEDIVRALSETIHTTVYRPSIIVGDSVTGKTSAFNVLYMPARLIVNGLFKALPALPNAPFDIVPVDYVADAINTIGAKDTKSGSCFHLTAGLGRESSPREIIEQLIAAFDSYRKRRLHAPAFISPEILLKALNSFSAAAEGLMQLEKKVCKQLNVFRNVVPFIPYMLQNPRFDTSDTDKLLTSPAPLFESYAEQLFRYCFETNWGRKPWTNPSNLSPWSERIGTAVR